MYSHPYATFTSPYTLSLKDIFPDNFTAEKEDDDEFIYPEVGDVLLIRSRIGNYLPGDYFFVHSQDEDVVSDCSLVGVRALEHFNPTVITDKQINDERAIVITNTYASAILWGLHLSYMSKESQ